MELTYIEKLRAKFNEVKQGVMPPDIMAMSHLKQHLEQQRLYISATGGRVSVFEDATHIVDLIAKLVDGRFERILSAMEEDEKKGSPRVQA